MARLSAEDYGTTTTRPPDFDQFWDETLALAAKVPLDASVEPIPLRSTDEVEVFEVRYASLDGVRIACWYCLPRQRGNRPVERPSKRMGPGRRRLRPEVCDLVRGPCPRRNPVIRRVERAA